MADLERQATTPNDIYRNHLSLKDSKEYIKNNSPAMNVIAATAPAAAG